MGVITFENLYELVRNEKTNDEIQELNPEIYIEIIEYLNTKLSIYKDSKARKIKDTGNIKQQIISARKLVKQLYELRERKILQLAINKSRTGSESIKDNKLLKEEKEIFSKVTNDLNYYRQGVLRNIMDGKLPFDSENVQEPTKEEEKKNESVGLKDENIVPKEPKINSKDSSIEETQASEIEESNDEEKEISPKTTETQLIKFTKPVSKFYGKQVEIYGPFKPGDMANLDKDIAKIITSKDYAIEIKQSQSF